MIKTFRKALLFVCILIIINTLSFASQIHTENILSEYTYNKIDEFYAFRTASKSMNNKEAIDGLKALNLKFDDEIASYAKDKEQEVLIIDSLYLMEIYEHSVDAANRDEKRQQMKVQFKKNLACLNERNKDKRSSYLYLVCGDVMSYYMTRSIPATLKYGLTVKDWYEKGSEGNNGVVPATISLGNWYFFAPAPLGGSKKALKAYETALNQSKTKDDLYLTYKTMSQLYFEMGKSELSKEYLNKARDLNVGTKELNTFEEMNKNGTSMYDYMRNRAGIDEEIPEDKKTDDDRE